jgi:hypothetical protein
MSWTYGEMTVAEALGEVVKCAADVIQNAAVDGMVYIDIACDGSFTVSKPSTATHKEDGEK